MEVININVNQLTPYKNNPRNNNEAIQYVANSIKEFGFKAQVYVSPVFGKIKPRDIVDYMKTYNLQGVRLQLQIHKFIWPPEMKGV